MSGCYGVTNGGTRCQRPDGHYPATKHRIDDGGFMEWTDEGMAEFKRIAEDPEFPQRVEQQRQQYEARQALITRTRDAIHAEIKRQTDQEQELFVEITDETWLIDAGINLQLLAMAIVDSQAAQHG